MKRLIVVYNPRSSKYLAVKRDVLEKVRNLAGWTVGKYEVQKELVEVNAKRLAEFLKDGDLVVAAGGDGTVAVAVNGIILSRKKATLGVLPYGDFNDFAKTTKTKTLEEIIEKFQVGEGKKFWPLEVVIDGRHWRYAVGYVTVGLFAKAAGIFDGGKVRKGLKHNRGNRVYSLWQLVKWYIPNRKKNYLPEMGVNGIGVVKNTTDYVAMNAGRMGGVVWNEGWWEDAKKFESAARNLSGFWSMVGFMLGGMIRGFRGNETHGDKIVFAEKSDVEIQTEGEKLEISAKEISVKKAEKTLKIIMR